MSDTEALISRSDIIEAASRIEPLPATVNRLMELTAGNDYAAADIVEVVQYDAALAGDILVRANSAASASRREIADIRDAISRVGASTVVELSLARAMRERVSGPIVAYDLGPDELWRHGLTASVAATVVRRAAAVPVPASITTAALIHDIGKQVIGDCLPESLQGALLAAAEHDGIPLDEAERLVLGLDHGEVSGVVARTWGLPVSVQGALTRHEHAADSDDLLTHALIVADRIAHAVEAMGTPDDTDVFEMVPELETSLDACGIPAAGIPDLVGATADAALSVLAGFR